MSDHTGTLLDARTLAAWRRAVRHEGELVRDIADAHKAGKAKKADFASIRYLDSFHAHLVATVKAYRRMPRHQRPSLDTVPDCARNLDPWKASHEEVVVSLKAKRGDPHDFRMIMAFGIENRARQYLVGEVLAARANLAPNQFFYRGGIPTAIRTAATALKNGYRYATEIDISSCFDSFNPEDVPNLLPLPKEVTRNTVLSENFNIRLSASLYIGAESDTNESSREFLDSLGVQWGIPQGSAISSFIAEMMLAPVIEQLPNSGVAVAYADNILLLGRSNAEMVSMTKTLSSALAAHPAGPLTPNAPASYVPGDAVEFLGHEIRVEQDNVLIAPSMENLRRFRKTFNRKVADVRTNRITLFAAKGYVISWSSAFRLWDGVVKHRDNHLQKLQALCD